MGEIFDNEWRVSNQNEFEQRILQSVMHVLSSSNNGQGQTQAGGGSEGAGAIVGDFNTHNSTCMEE